ncbi:hypothetical protein B0H19DRAFT_113907 [Mycena capillaripes]|nr:hypothetical protein B0H19DRAFT_113907 [Mycena capillaripes]
MVRYFADSFKITGNNNNAPKPSLFGAQPAQPAQNAFGGTNLFGNNNQQQAPAQQQPTFGFGANNNAQQPQQPATANPRKLFFFSVIRIADILASVWWRNEHKSTVWRRC